MKVEEEQEREPERKEKGHVVVRLMPESETAKSSASSPSRSPKQRKKEVHHSKSLMSFVAAGTHDLGKITRISPKALSTLSGLIMSVVVVSLCFHLSFFLFSHFRVIMLNFRPFNTSSHEISFRQMFFFSFGSGFLFLHIVFIDLLFFFCTQVFSMLHAWSSFSC